MIAIIEKEPIPFTLDGDLYGFAIEGNQLGIADGSKYIVEFDGTVYHLTASVLHTTDEVYCLLMGNASIAGFEQESNEPFFIAYVPAQFAGNETGITSMATPLEGESHTISIYALTLFTKQTVTGFAFYEDYGLYEAGVSPPPFDLVLGNKYEVYWDGTTYVCEAQDLSAMIEGCIALGDLSTVGDQGNDEPFIIGYTEFGLSFFSIESVESHEIGVYDYVELTEPESPEGTILEEQTITFLPDEGFGGMCLGDIGTIEISEGEVYDVVFDGNTYTCTAEIMTLDQLTGIGLGNKSIVGIGDDTKEPFLIGVVGNYTHCLIAEFAETSYTVGIYTHSDEPDTPVAPEEPEEPEEPEVKDGVVLQDFSGGTTVYSGVGLVELLTSDGGTQLFSEGVAIEGTRISLDFTNGDHVVPADRNTLLRGVTIERPTDLIPANIRKGKIIGGIEGAFVGGDDAITKSVTPDFAEGDVMEVKADEGTLLKSVNILKPVELVPGNIISGVKVAGIEGAYQSPKLNSPTAVSEPTASSDGTQYLRVTNPSTNGNFAEKVQLLLLYTDGREPVVVAERAFDGGSYVDIYGSNFIRDNVHLLLANPCVRMLGAGFTPSDIYKATNTVYACTPLFYSITNASYSGFPVAFVDDVITISITPDTGFYLPREASMLDSNGEALDFPYTFDYDNKKLIVTISSIEEGLYIVVHCVDVPWLPNPVLSLDYSKSLLIVEALKYAETFTLSVNGEVVSQQDAPEPYEASSNVSAISGVTYGFSYDSTTGYYVSTNTGKHSTFSMCRLNLSVSHTSILTLSCISYGENNYDYGILSKLDTTLSSSSSADSSYHKSFRGASSASAVTVTYGVPAGEHFIYIKYRKDGSGVSGTDTFKFKVDSLVSTDTSAGSSEFGVSDYLEAGYGSYTMSVVASADGYTDSYPTTIEYNYHPVIALNGTVLSLVNEIPTNVSGFEMYFDDELVTTISYSGSDTFSVDLMDYSDYKEGLIIKPKVYIKAIGDTVSENISNTVNSEWLVPDGTYPIYGVSGLNGTTVSLTRTDNAVGMTYTKNSDGSITSSFDSVFPWNKTEIVTDEFGNEFVSFPQMFFRITTYNNVTAGVLTAIAVSEVPHDTGEWYEVRPFWYGRYGGSLSQRGYSDVLDSKRGVVRAANATRPSFSDDAENNGEGYHLLDVYHHTVLKFLWWIEWATKNSTSIMTGAISGTGTTGGTTAMPTGGTDSVTTPSGYELTRHQMRYHYIEDFVGNYFEFIEGILSLGGTTAWRDSISPVPQAKYSNHSYYHYPSYYNCANGCITGYGWDSEYPFMCLPSGSTSNSSYNSGFCDYVYRNSSYNYPRVGAAYGSSTTNQGLSYMYAGNYDFTSADIGARLMKSHFT